MDNNETISTNSIELLEKFLFFVVHERTKNPHLMVHISDLRRIRNQIQNNTKDFSPNEVAKIFLDILQIIIGWNERIENQLYLLWDAYTEITKISNQNKVPFSPAKKFSENVEKILQTHSIYEDIILESKKIKSEKTYFYSLFYFHIANTETLGNALLKEFHLEKDYDPFTIFSVKTKIPRGESFDTDIRTIRNALAHFNYKIIKEKNYWKIKFSMNDYGYNFNKLFTRNEFVKFLDDGYSLLESQLALIWVIASVSICEKFFGKSNFPRKFSSA